MNLEEYYNCNPKLYTDDAYLEKLFLDNVFYPEYGDAGLDYLQYQKPIYDPYYDQNYYIDFVIEHGERKYALELDGYYYHGKQPKDEFEREKEKSNEITREGYELIRYTYKKIKYTPKQVRKELRERLPLYSQYKSAVTVPKPVGQQPGSRQDGQQKTIAQPTVSRQDGQSIIVGQQAGSRHEGQAKTVTQQTGSRQDGQQKKVAQPTGSRQDGQQKNVAQLTGLRQEGQTKTDILPIKSGKESQTKSYYFYEKKHSGGCRKKIFLIIVILIVIYIIYLGGQESRSKSHNIYVNPTNSSLSVPRPTSTKKPFANTPTSIKVTMTSIPTKKTVPTKTPTVIKNWSFEKKEISLRKGETVQLNIIFPMGLYFGFNPDCGNIAEVSHQNPNRYLTVIGLSPGTCRVELIDNNGNHADWCNIIVTSK